MGGGVSGRRATREVGGGGAGGAESEGRSGESGGSYATSDVETEEGKEENAPLTVSPLGMQERGERGIRGDARAGGRDGGKGTSFTAAGGYSTTQKIGRA